MVLLRNESGLCMKGTQHWTRLDTPADTPAVPCCQHITPVAQKSCWFVAQVFVTGWAKARLYNLGTTEGIDALCCM